MEKNNIKQREAEDAKMLLKDREEELKEFDENSDYYQEELDYINEINTRYETKKQTLESLPRLDETGAFFVDDHPTIPELHKEGKNLMIDEDLSKAEEALKELSASQ